MNKATRMREMEQEAVERVVGGLIAGLLAGGAAPATVRSAFNNVLKDDPFWNALQIGHEAIIDNTPNAPVVQLVKDPEKS